MAGKRNFYITKGDDFLTTVYFVASDGVTPVNITGRTYTSQVRRVAASTDTPDATFTCTVTDGVNGVLEMLLPHAQTETLQAITYVWDLEQDNAGFVTTILSGSIEVEQDVTK